MYSKNKHYERISASRGGIDSSLRLVDLPPLPPMQTELFNRNDLGYKLGMTRTIKNIFINANYFKSFKPIRVNDFLSPIIPDTKATEYRNNSIEVSIGYHFNLKKKKIELSLLFDIE